MDGRIFQIIGDGVVALFNSAGSAVKSAVVWQTDIARPQRSVAAVAQNGISGRDQFG